MNRPNNEIRRERRAPGFTLIELLLVVAIIGILSTAAVISVPQILNNTRITAAQNGISAINTALTSYSMQHNGKYPETLEALTEGDDENPPIIENGEAALTDPWGNPYRYQKTGKRILISSDGPDGEQNTEDDITNRDKKK